MLGRRSAGGFSNLLYTCGPSTGKNPSAVVGRLAAAEQQQPAAAECVRGSDANFDYSFCKFCTPCTHFDGTCTLVSQHDLAATFTPQMSFTATVVEEKGKKDEETPISEVIHASERISVRSEQKALIHDCYRQKNYGFVGEIITVSEETLSELNEVLRKSKHSSVDILLDCFHRASGNLLMHSTYHLCYQLTNVY